MEKHIVKIAAELQLELWQVSATALLLAEGSTVPFIARYRKEVTGSLDEVAITAIRDRVAQLTELAKRREVILKSLTDQGNLTDELKEKIEAAESLAVLEDIYLPFRPKRRTRATIARERGLEPLAHLIFSQEDFDTSVEASSFVDADKGVESIEDALSGARDILAEWINEDQEVRAQMRSLFFEKGFLISKVVQGKEKEGVKYKDYFDWQESVAKAPSHRILAMRRGEKEGFLSLHLAPPEEEALALMERASVKGDFLTSKQVRMAAHDSYKRLLSNAMETELRVETKKRADEEAIRIFADNLRQLLLAPPLGQKRILPIDPGFRTGCKVVCLDPQGKLIHTDTIYPFKSERGRSEAATKLRDLCERFRVEAIAIGNGTGGRETEAFVKGLSLSEEVRIVMVNEGGASVYSASEAAREEFPDQDVTVRGAISIGRRLMDPLAELVKIDPKSIGVGQYQHDVDQKRLKESLDDIAVSCVNAVGVEANTASWQLLTYVSGLGPQLAKKIVEYRDEHGPFSSRETLKQVPRLGAKVFEQAAGFLRLQDSTNFLDKSAVHPESYYVVEAMARDLGCSAKDLMQQEELRKQIKKEDYVTEKVGIPTLDDILEELAKPGRDPRTQFEGIVFAENVQKMEDLIPGMKLPGVVTNVTAFGAFVDIGVHQDGLVHISELADRFVKDPSEVVKVHEKVMVRVLDVDHERKRIALSMRENRRVTTNDTPVQTRKETRKKAGKPNQKPSNTIFNNPFADAFKRE
jgi:uncharacterized protein